MLTLLIKVTLTIQLMVLPIIAYANDVLKQPHSLSDIYSLAKEHDATYQQALASYQSSSEIRKQARAAVLPSLSLDANKSETDKANNVEIERTNYGATLNQVIFDYRAFKGVKQAGAIQQQAEKTLLAAQQSLILRTVQAYFNVLSAQDQLRFTSAEKDSLGKQLDQSQQRFDIGLIAITDLKEAQANYDLSIADQLEAENNLLTSLEAIHTLTATPVDALQSLQSDYPLKPPVPNNIQQWLDWAKQQNPELLIAKYTAEANKHAVSIQRGDRFPKLGFSASRNYTEDSVLSPNGEYDTTLSLNFSMPLFEGGAINSRVRQAQYDYDAAYYAFVQQTRLTQQQTRDAYQNMRSAISRAKAFKRALESTKSALNASEVGYQVGTRTPADVLNALDKVYQAESNYANARYTYILNAMQLLATAGKLQESDLQVINSWLQ